MIILKILITLIIVSAIALIINGIEDYHSMIKIPFGETMAELTLPVVDFTNNGKTFNFLVDTGASYSVIDSRILKKIKHIKLKDTGNAYGVEGNIVPVEYAKITLNHEKGEFTDDFQVMKVEAFDNIKKANKIEIIGILGSSFLEKYGFVIDFNNLIIYTKSKLCNDISSN